MSYLLKFLLDPSIVIAVLLTWGGTSVYHGVTEWINQRQIARGLAHAVSERDEKWARAVKFKDQLIEAVAKDKEQADVHNEHLRRQLDEAEAARRAANVADCVWSDDDIRMLNGRRRATRSSARD